MSLPTESVPGAAQVPAPPAAASEERIRYSRFLPATDAEGPGRRAALWLQGCSIRCPGCFNPHLWAPRGGTLAGTAGLAADLTARALAAGSEGLTLLGGEPFDQAGAAAAVAGAFRNAGLSVMTFTGYLHRDLQQWARQRQDIAALLEATDLLADGPYLASQPELRRPWIGSANQGLTALTGRYRPLLAELADQRDRIEIRVAADGSVGINGWATEDQLDALLSGLGTRADRPGLGHTTTGPAAAGGQSGELP